MGESEVVNSVLRDMGAAGAAISVLLATVGALAGVIVYLFRQNGQLNQERRAENAAMIKTLEGNNTAINKFSDSTDERNAVTQDLADAINEQAKAFEMVNQRVGFFHEANTEKLKDMRDVVAAGSEAMRVNTGMVTEVRNGNLAIVAAVGEITTRLDRLAARRNR